MTNDYHLQCRAAVAALIEADRALVSAPAGLTDVLEVKEMDEFDGNLVSGPSVVVYFMGQANPVGGTTGRNDWDFPLVVALKTTGVKSGEHAGPLPTTFLGAIQDIFHERRPAGVPSFVIRCRVDPQGATATDEPKYQQLTAATTVVLTARLPRRR